MKNLFDNWRRRGAALSEAEETALSSDLGAAYDVPVPSNLTWEAAMAAQPLLKAPLVRTRGAQGRKLGFGVAVAAATVAAVAVVLPMGGGGGTPTVSAQEIIDRSIAAASGQGAALGSYHMVIEYDYGDGTPKMVSETWRDGESRWRTESRSIGTNGPALFGAASDGTWWWLYGTENSVTRASRGDASMLQGSISMVLDFGTQSFDAVVGNLLMAGCQEATLDGVGTALGRSVHVVRIEPTGAPCEGGKLLNESTVAWIDTETFMLLRVERTNHDSGQVGITNVTLFETSTPEPSTFVYQAPEGVAVIAAADYSGMKNAISGPPEELVQEPPTTVTTSASWAYTLSSVGEATSVSDVVAHVRILPGVVVHLDEDETSANGPHPREFELTAQVIGSSKGDFVAGDTFSLRQMSGVYGGSTLQSYAEIPLEPGNEYLLFLSRSPDGSYRTDSLRTFQVQDSAIMPPGSGWGWRHNLGLVGKPIVDALAEARSHANDPRPAWLPAVPAIEPTVIP